MSLFKALFAENIPTLAYPHKGILTQRSKANGRCQSNSFFIFSNLLIIEQMVLSVKISAGSHKA